MKTILFFFFALNYSTHSLEVPQEINNENFPKMFNLIAKYYRSQLLIDAQNNNEFKYLKSALQELNDDSIASICNNIKLYSTRPYHCPYPIHSVILQILDFELNNKNIPRIKRAWTNLEPQINPFELLLDFPKDIVNLILEKSVIDMIQLKTIYDCLNYKIIQHNRVNLNNPKKLYRIKLKNVHYRQFIKAFLENINAPNFNKNFKLSIAPNIYAIIKSMVHGLNVSPLYKLLHWYIPMNSTYLNNQFDMDKMHVMTNAPIIEVLNFLTHKILNDDFDSTQSPIEGANRIYIQVDTQNRLCTPTSLLSIIYTYYVFDLYMKVSN